MLTWLRALFAPLIAWFTGGGYVPQPQRAYLALGPGFTVTDDSTNNRTLIDVGGAGVAGTFGALSASSLSVGPYSFDPQPQVTTIGDQTLNLLATPIALGLRQSVKLRLNVRASIFGQTVIPTMELLGDATLTNLSGTATIFWKSGASSPETNEPQPFVGLVGVQPVTVTGAVNNGSGAIRLSVSSTSNMVAGQTIVSVANVGGVPNATDTWVIDAVGVGTIDLRGSTFAGTYTTGGTVTFNGAITFVASGATGQVQATGVKGPAWQQSEAVTAYTLRRSPGGLYLCTTSGTTSGSGTGPSGTGVGIVDGSAVWEHIATSPSATLIWQATPETWTLQR